MQHREPITSIHAVYSAGAVACLRQEGSEMDFLLVFAMGTFIFVQNKVDRSRREFKTCNAHMHINMYTHMQFALRLMYPFTWLMHPSN